MCHVPAEKKGPATAQKRNTFEQSSFCVIKVGKKL